MKVCVIGGGVSGLLAIKSCLEDGCTDIDCYERTSGYGGLWNYREEVTSGLGSVMRSTVINTSKEAMAFSDFPPPRSFPNFMHNSKVYAYIKDYSEKFGLRKYVKFETDVVSVIRSDDHDSTGNWDVTICTKQSKKTITYNAIFLCTGHHAEPRWPNKPGISTFPKPVTHSHDYRVPDEFADKEVLVIGIGNSGGDIAVELSKVAKTVYLSTRRGAWVLPRSEPSGYPTDFQVSRFLQGLNERVPVSVGNAIGKRLFIKLDHSKFGLEPDHSLFSQHPMVNDDLPNRLLSGLVQIVDDVTSFNSDGTVTFKTGDKRHVDHVIVATGYKFGFPFLEKGIVDVTEDNEVDLYQLMFPVKATAKNQQQMKDSLAVIGCVQPIGSLMPISEIQTRLAVQVFKGVVKLPDEGERRQEVDRRRSAMKARYVNSPRHTIQVDVIPYNDGLAELIQAKPDFSPVSPSSLFFSDFALWSQCVFGPYVPYQYRLVGPHSWPGARNAIMTVGDRVDAGMNPGGRRIATPAEHQGGPFSSISGSLTTFLLIVFTVVFVIWMSLIVVD